MEDTIRNSIKVLTRIYYDYQRERMMLDGRLGITKAGDLKKGVPERDQDALNIIFMRRAEVAAIEDGTLQGFKDKETGEWDRQGSLIDLVHRHPLWKAFLQEVKGCGEAIAAVIISEFDIHKAPTVSNLWSFAGLAPGKDRKVKGQKCPYNQFLRAKLCGVLGSSFLKCNSPYRVHYDNMKHRYESEKWGMDSKNPTDKNRPKAGHQHKGATRYMVKMFLIDLYVAWRTLEGLEVREPYQAEYLGHKHSA